MSASRAAATGSERQPFARLVQALMALQERHDASVTDAFMVALESVATSYGLPSVAVSIDGAPLIPITVQVGEESPMQPEHVLVAPTDATPLGWVRTDGDARSVSAVVDLLAGAVDAVRGRQRARRAEANLAALDAAVQGIAGVHALDRVLQLIVDRVRELADAQYAALGMIDEEGRMERFLTSGISAEQRRRIGALPRGRGLLGLIIRERSSYRIADIATDPRRHGFPPHHPEMHAFLGVPVTYREQSLGNLYLTNKRGGAEFSESDQVLVERFARHAGLAIENARLGQRVQQLAVIEDRERIGRDLHDGVIQRIYGATLALDEVPELTAERPDLAAARVEQAIDSLHATIGEIREFIYGLRPAMGDEQDMTTAFELLADEVRRQVGTDVDVTVAATPAPDIGRELLSITREALSNVVRHAAAGSVSISLVRVGDALRLEVADDGRGFDPDARRSTAHQGLANMEERAARLRGSLTVASRPGAGTRIIVALPGDDGTQEDRSTE